VSAIKQEFDMMTVAITWNGGENAVMLSPSVKVWVAIFSIFTIGMVCVGGAALALIASAGYLVWILAALTLHVLTVTIYGSIFSFAFSLFLCAGLLVLFILLCFRVFGISTPCKGGVV
jgi:hypothetical protein